MLLKNIRLRKTARLHCWGMRSYTRMTTEKYLTNVRDGLTNQNIQEKKLQPLLEANHTSDTRTHLIGVPITPKDDGGFIDTFVGAVGRT